MSEHSFMRTGLDWISSLLHDITRSISYIRPNRKWKSWRLKLIWNERNRIITDMRQTLLYTTMSQLNFGLLRYPARQPQQTHTNRHTRTLSNRYWWHKTTCIPQDSLHKNISIDFIIPIPWKRQNTQPYNPRVIKTFDRYVHAFCTNNHNGWMLNYACLASVHANKLDRNFGLESSINLYENNLIEEREVAFSYYLTFQSSSCPG